MQKLPIMLLLTTCVLGCLGDFGQSSHGAEGDPPAQSIVNKVEAGDAYMAAEDYEKAIAAYADSASSSDKQIAKEAQEKLAEALAAKRRDAKWPKWPIFQWSCNYLLELLICATVIFIAWQLILWWNRRIYSDPWNSRWKLKMHTAWTQEMPTDIFLEEFKATTREIASLGESMRGTPFANRLNNPVFDRDRLLVTLDLTDVLEKEKLTIQGVDIGWMYKSYERAVDHLSWVLDIHIVKLDVIYAYASLRIRSSVEETWRIPRPGQQPPANVHDAARKLAFEIFSKGWTRT